MIRVGAEDVSDDTASTTTIARKYRLQVMSEHHDPRWNLWKVSGRGVFAPPHKRWVRT